MGPARQNLKHSLDSAFALRRTCDGGEVSDRAWQADRIRSPFRPWPAKPSDKHARSRTWVSHARPRSGSRNCTTLHADSIAASGHQARGFGLGLGQLCGLFALQSVRPARLTGHARRPGGAGRPAARHVPCKDTTGSFAGGRKAGLTMFLFTRRPRVASLCGRIRFGGTMQT